MMSSDPGSYHPWWLRVLTTVLQLVVSPGWQGTLKVAVLAAVFAAIYIGIRLAT